MANETREVERAPSHAPGGDAASLVDTRGRPLRDLRISVTDRCNFRCTYCMPAEIFGDRYTFLPRAEILSFEEIERVTRLLVPLGVKKLRITGGEPLIRHELPDLIRKLSRIDGIDDIALTTNATLLDRQAKALRDAGLHRLTISLDSLDPDVFLEMNGGKLGLDRVLEGIGAAEEAGFDRLKINCVVQKGVNDHTLIDLARHFKGTPHIVRFIEFMDVGTRNGWELSQVVPSRELVERIGAEMPIEPVDPNYLGEVAKRWRYKDGEGEIGFITSVTEPFCGGCTRARLTTDGQLVTCLFASGGTDLRAPLRAGASDEELRALVGGVWQARTDRYSEERTGIMRDAPDTQKGSGRVEMYQIGG
jgi:cyclic pyranopterin phosphate synthase